MSVSISSKQLKNIFIILISCITFSFFILNTNKVQTLTHKIKKNLLPRTLAESTTGTQKTTKICEKTSSNLKEYFKTGERALLNLEDDNTEDYDEYYVEALIQIVKHYYTKKEKEQNKDNKIRILKDDKDDDYKKYVFKYAYHILPLLIILGIGILSLLGWLVCCICVCKKCSCCVCKVPKCKTPATVLSIISYVIVAVISFYALVEQNKVFSGLADIECSVLRFTDDVLEGETNKFPPYWAGIDKISSILTQFKTKIHNFDPADITNLEDLKSEINTKKSAFESQLEDTNTLGIYTGYKASIGTNNYQLDLANQFGDCSSAGTQQPNSVCKLWLDEYANIYDSANNNMNAVSGTSGTTPGYLSSIIGGNAETEFETSIQKIGELKTEFNSLKQLISDQIIEKADDIDKKGKLVYTLFFTFLMIFCAAIIVFMFLLCLCSGELCTNLTCCQCFCKFFLHFFWNLFALIMFVLFMGGCLFTISGTLGDDLVNVISYLTSKDNLEGDDTIILGNVKQYLNQCFNYDGNILTQLGLYSSEMDNFEQLKKAQIELEELKTQFNDKKYKFVYSEYCYELEQRINYNSKDLELVALDDGVQNIKFCDLLTSFNDYADSNSKNENWDVDSTSENACSTSDRDEGTHISKIIYHPKKCFPTVKTWAGDSSLSDAKNKLTEIQIIINSVSPSTSTIKDKIETLKNLYDTFLQSEIQTLDKYIEKLSSFTDLAKPYTSEDDDLFSFMNCKFIKDNVDVILHYLKHSFQNDIYEVGIYLLIAAFAMPFGISLTILLIMISNDEIEKNKEKKKKEVEKRKSMNNINNVSPPKIEGVDNNGNSTEQRPLNNNPNSKNV